MSESFWVIPPLGQEKSPLAILREQSQALTEATHGSLRGDVSAEKWGNRLNISLSIVVPALDGYQLEILQYQQPALIYPGRLEVSLGDPRRVEIKNETEFRAQLKAVLSSPPVQRTIAALLLQIEAS